MVLEAVLKLRISINQDENQTPIGTDAADWRG
jgi:hypothetical protein